MNVVEVMELVHGVFLRESPRFRRNFDVQAAPLAGAPLEDERPTVGVRVQPKDHVQRFVGGFRDVQEKHHFFFGRKRRSRRVDQRRPAVVRAARAFRSVHQRVFAEWTLRTRESKEKRELTWK